jgi:hypothetical protein
MNRFDQFCNQIIQEQYTTTAREVLYRRYGREVADNMIAKIKARGKDSYLEKKYILPDYSDANLDRVIKVILKNDMVSREYGKKISGGATPLTWYDKNPEIYLASDAPTIGDSVKELEGKSGVPQHRTSPYDVLGHETTHTLQIDRNTPSLTYEFAAVLGELKRWYYGETGILLDADATDVQINQLINYCKQRDIFNKLAYGKDIDFEKLLRTSEGKEVFRRIVKQTPVKSNTATV